MKKAEKSSCNGTTRRKGLFSDCSVLKTLLSIYFGMKKKVPDNKALILLAIVIVLLAANIILMLLPKNENADAVSLYKGFAAQTHASIQQVKNESAKIDQNLVVTADMNADERAEIALLREFYGSMNSDIIWISDKENTVYWQLAATQNPATANNLMREEMAIMVVSGYIFALNNDAITDGMSGLLDRNEAIEEAKASLSWIAVGDLLNDDVAQEMIAETLIQKNDIITETKQLMGEYLELRKNALAKAKAGADAEYVAAMNLLELGYLLEINNSTN